MATRLLNFLFPFRVGTGSGTPVIITSIVNNTGVSGDVVTINGSGFLLAAVLVMFNLAIATIISQTDTVITCIVPAGTGTVSIIVVNSDFNSDTLLNGFTYNAGGTGGLARRSRSNLSLSLSI